MKTLQQQIGQYDLPFHCIAGIMECVNALHNYDKLPVATKESLQAICDLYNVSFTFGVKGKKMMLTGIFKTNIVSYLYPDGKIEESQKFLKNSKEYILVPFADNMLSKNF